MTLTTHGVVGAATASFFPPQYYPLAWLASFISHFFVDAIPHWDYATRSYRKGTNPLESDFVLNYQSIADIIKIGLDFSLGISLAYLLFPAHLFNPWLIVGGAFFGILPDPLQFAYWKIRRQPLTTLQKLHTGIHAQTKLAAWPVGIFSQIVFLIFILLMVFCAHAWPGTVSNPF